MTATEAWAREFFTGLAVELWLAAPTAELTMQEADFLGQELQPMPGAKLLDLACGGGRHALELAARGYSMTGVDISAEFLADARLSTESRHLAIDWHHRSIIDLPYQSEFDGAYCLGNALTGLDDADHRNFFAGVARALKPGAKFVVNNGTLAETIIPNWKDRPWWSLGDYRLMAVNTYDAAQSRLLTEYTMQIGTRTETKSGFSQVYTCREFGQLLRDAGFDELQLYSTIQREPYRLGSHELLLTSRKCR